VILYGLRATGNRVAAGLFGSVYLAYCLYGWIIPPLVRRWMGAAR